MEDYSSFLKAYEMGIKCLQRHLRDERGELTKKEEGGRKSIISLDRICAKKKTNLDNEISMYA